eukprot:scaffold6409_cov143-Skeletonema_marinoi.AAC.5
MVASWSFQAIPQGLYVYSQKSIKWRRWSAVGSLFYLIQTAVKKWQDAGESLELYPPGVICSNEGGGYKNLYPRLRFGGGYRQVWGVLYSSSDSPPCVLSAQSGFSLLPCCPVPGGRYIGVSVTLVILRDSGNQ